MRVNKVFISVRAGNFSGLSEWWSRLIGRTWAREPMPSCHEWDLTESVLLQVLDAPESRETVTLTLHVASIDAERERLSQLGIQTPEPKPVNGFSTLRFLQFNDPEGNIVGLLDGE
jgi:hypothetical protein